MNSRVVLLAGSSGGIGTVAVRDLEAEGYVVVGMDRHAVPNVPVGGFFQVDLADPEQSHSVIAAVKKRYPELWAVVYTAGIYPVVDCDHYTVELWDKVHAVNVRSAFFLAQQLRSSLVAGGRMVFVSSGAAYAGSRDPGYSASKAGLGGVVRSLANSLSSDGILVNAVCPGLIRTAMSERMSSERINEHLTRACLGRIGEPEEVSIAITFLLDERNSYMTGTALDVNGGLFMR